MSRQLSPMQHAIADHEERGRVAERERWWAARAAGLHMDDEDRRLNATARLNLFTHGTEHPDQQCCSPCYGEDDPMERWDWWGCCCRSPQAQRRD